MIAAKRRSWLYGHLADVIFDRRASFVEASRQSRARRDFRTIVLPLISRYTARKKTGRILGFALQPTLRRKAAKWRSTVRHSVTIVRPTSSRNFAPSLFSITAS
jgi:hypothetical protein